MRETSLAPRTREIGPVSRRLATVRLEQCDSQASLPEIVALFQRQGNRHSYDDLKWYLGPNGYGIPTVWVLRGDQDRDLVGFCCVMPRLFQWGATRLAVGIVGNFIVDAAKRRSLGAVDLLRAAQSLVARKEIDLLLGIADSHARDVDSRMGCHVLGPMELQTFIRRSGGLLRSRLGWLGIPASFAIDVLAASLRSSAPSIPGDFEVVDLPENVAHHVETWPPPEDRFVQQPSAAFLQHFVDAPSTRYRRLGVVDRKSREVCGYVVVKHIPGRIHICECSTDAARLSQAQAIVTVCHRWKGIVSVFGLTGSDLQRELQKFGFIRLPARWQHHDRWLMGYWRSDHPLAHEFAQPARWNVFLESTYA